MQRALETVPDPQSGRGGRRIGYRLFGDLLLMSHDVHISCLSLKDGGGFWCDVPFMAGVGVNTIMNTLEMNIEEKDR